MKGWVTQLRKGLLEFCILNLLAGGETYGYELIQRLKKIEELAVTESTAYPILNRLREDGYVTVRVEPSRDGPPRRYYSLTGMGKHRISGMNAYWDQLSNAIESLRSAGRKGDK